ncbi:MAG: helix-turn-helix domain-containing protein [Melioribacteraceae bacterium]|nr:helix-turn-helix domain-containing protein [Melioribacteraceae bacterium]
MLEFKEIITVIFAIGAAQAVFLFFILWKKKENSFANKFLAVTMLIFAIDLLAGVSYLSGFVEKIPWIMGLNNSFPYLYGPLIYLYVIFLIHDREFFAKYDYLHFIPFLLIQVYGIFFFYFEGKEYQLSMLDFDKPNPWHIELIGKLIPVSGIIYVLFTIISTVRFNRNIKNSFANVEKIDLSWLIYLVVGTAVVWLSVLLSYLLGFIYGDETQANLLIYITLSVFLYVFAFKSYKQPEIITEPILNKEGRTYKKSGLSAGRADEILDKVVKLMNNDKPYLNTELNLSNLANHLSISTHNLSEVINTKLKQNFYDFVNSYRVEEVKRLIENDKDSVYSILSHGYEAGFTSKSAFYSSFKKNTGITPAQYRKEVI